MMTLRVNTRYRYRGTAYGKVRVIRFNTDAAARGYARKVITSTRETEKVSRFTSRNAMHRVVSLTAYEGDGDLENGQVVDRWTPKDGWYKARATTYPRTTRVNYEKVQGS